jgi:hypothetical protein
LQHLRAKLKELDKIKIVSMCVENDLMLKIQLNHKCLLACRPWSEDFFNKKSAKTRIIT